MWVMVGEGVRAGRGGWRVCGEWRVEVCEGWWRVGVGTCASRGGLGGGGAAAARGARRGACACGVWEMVGEGVRAGWLRHEFFKI